MDAFSLLRYWRSNNGGGDVTINANLRTSTTIVTQTSESDENSVDDNDHGPFFDLEFSLPNNDEINENDEDESDGSDDDDDDDDVEDESDLKFTLLSGSSGGDNSSSNVNVSVSSPSDDLFFKGSFIPVSNDSQTTSLKTNSKPVQSRVSLVKHATKLRVMMLKFKKSKSNVTESSQTTEEEEEEQQQQKKNVDSGSASGSASGSSKSSSTTTVKFKVAEVPIVSLFKRDNSSKNAQKKRQTDDESVANSTSSDEKKFSKEAMQKYLRKVKPLYVRVSKKYGDKLKSPSLETELRKQLTVTEVPKRSPATESNVEGSEPPLLNGKGLKQGNLPAGLRVVCKHLGKSRSGSTAVIAAAPALISSKRRDDSLLQQQDGIQSAILHCKRSFKASRDSDCSSSLSTESAAANGKIAAEGKDEISKR